MAILTRYMTVFQASVLLRWPMPNPFDFVMFVLLIWGVIDQTGWIWEANSNSGACAALKRMWTGGERKQRIAAPVCWSWPGKSTDSKSWSSACLCRFSCRRRWPTSSITPKQKDVVPAMTGSVVVAHLAFSIRDSRVQPGKWRMICPA